MAIGPETMGSKGVANCTLRSGVCNEIYCHLIRNSESAGQHS